jgi:hypothetical protein
MIKSHEEQERKIDTKYAQYVADLKNGTATPTPVRPSLPPEPILVREAAPAFGFQNLLMFIQYCLVVSD